MLSTQVSYWANREQARHNLEGEKQNLIDLQRKENELRLNEQNLIEAIRHNRASEDISRTQAAANIKQAEAALSQAKSAKAKAKADIKLAAANVALAQAKVRQTQTSSLLNTAQTAKVGAETKKTKVDTKSSKLQQGITKKESKYYLLTKVAVPIVNSALNVASKAMSVKKGKK